MTAKRIFYIGDLWEVTAEISSPTTGLDVDPESITVEIVPPTGLPTTEAAVRDSQGHYHVGPPLTEHGEWRAVWRTSGKYQGVATLTLSVKRPTS